MTANGEVSSIWGNATGRTAGSLLAINNDCLPRPCGIPGKTSAIPSVCSQGNGSWLAMYVIMSVVVDLAYPGNTMSSPASDDRARGCPNCSGSHSVNLGGKEHGTKHSRANHPPLSCLARFVYDTSYEDWTAGRHISALPLAHTFLTNPGEAYTLGEDCSNTDQAVPEPELCHCRAE